MPTLPEQEDVWYLACHALIITNAPGSVPSTSKVGKGERFQLDGDEVIELDYLIRRGFVAIYTDSTAQKKLRAVALEAATKKRNNPLGRYRQRGPNGENPR